MAQFFGLQHLRMFSPTQHPTLDLWQAAGELSNTLLRKGKSVGLSDCYLAASAKAHKVKILTLDKHFAIIKGAFGVEIYEVKPAP